MTNREIEIEIDVRRQLSINQATTRLRWNHRQFLEGMARHGIGQIALWRDKVAEIGVRQTRSLLGSLNLSVSGLNRAGPMLHSDPIARASARDDARRAIDEAHELGAACLLFHPGTLQPDDKDIAGARNALVDVLTELLQYSRGAGVKLALEPLHPMLAGDRSCLNTMKQANDICDGVGPDVGIVADVYHVWWDPDLEAQIARAGGQRLLGFHVNDWLVPTRDLLFDRGMMGDGVIDLRTIWDWMTSAGYAGPVEVEIFSRDWWQRDPDGVVEMSISRCIDCIFDDPSRNQLAAREITAAPHRISPIGDIVDRA